MNEPHDPNRTIDVPSAPADSLDAGLAAGFGRRPAVRAASWRDCEIAWATCGRYCCARPRARAPTSSSRRPMPCHRRSRRATATSCKARSPAAAWARCCGPRRRSGPRPGRQGAAGEARPPPGGGAAVRRGGADRRAVAAPRRGARLRHRPLRRPALLHHEARQGTHAGGAAERTHRAGPGPAALPDDRVAGGADAGLRPCQGGDPPRPEARERHGGRVRRGPGHGLGPGQGAGRGGRRG